MFMEGVGYERETVRLESAMKGERGRVVSGMQKQKWYVDLRHEHPTEKECWPTELSQVNSVKAERDRHPGLPVVVSVRPYLRTVLLGEPYAPSAPAARIPSSCERGCVNPWHKLAAVKGFPGRPLGSMSGRGERPMSFSYLEDLVEDVWSGVIGGQWPRTDPDIPAHRKRVQHAIDMMRAAGDLGRDSDMNAFMRATVMAEAGFRIRTDNMPAPKLKWLRDLLPVGLRVALGIGPEE